VLGGVHHDPAATDRIWTVAAVRKAEDPAGNIGAA